MTNPDRPNLDELLEHSPWLRKLAIGLVRDESRADDVVQQAYLAAVERPPADLRSPGGWLRRVVTNLAARSHREDSRRRAREERVARPEGIYASEALVERAELQKHVAEAVVDLDEPYRAVILLHYYEELTPHEIARELGVPVATVWTRLSRAKERLRRKLDGRYGSRAAWCAPLLPFILDPAAAGSLAGTSSGATGVGGTHAGTATGVQTVAASKAVLAVVCTVTFFVGFAAVPFFGFSSGDRSREIVDGLRGDAADLRGRIASLTARRDELRGEQRRLMSGNDELAARATELELSLAVALQPEPAEGTGMPIPYGRFAELEVLESADWLALAEALLEMNRRLGEMEGRWIAGEEIDFAEKIDLVRVNLSLVPFALNLIGQIPTSAMNGNGEFTHPVVVTNLSAAMLELVGLPLDESQRQQLAELGLQHEAEWDLLEAGYEEGVPRLERILDEVELKNMFMDGFREILTVDQHQVIEPVAGMENVMGFDALSPVLVFGESRNVLPVRSRDSVPDALRRRFAEIFDLQAAELEAHTEVFETWAREIDPYLEWYDGLTNDGLPMEIALGIGRAQVNAVKALEDVLPPRDKRKLWSTRLLVLLRLKPPL